MDVIAVRAVLGLCRWQGTADDNGRSNPQRTAAAYSNRAACVDNENFGHAELQKLRNSHHLKRIDLHEITSQPFSRVTNNWLKSLAESPAAQSLASPVLHLWACPNITDEAIPHLNQMRSLRALLLVGTDVSNAGIQKLDLPELGTLNLGSSSLLSPECLLGLETRSPNIATIGFDRCPFGEVSLEPASTLLNLQSLDLSLAGVSDDSMIPVTKILILSGHYRKGNPKIEDITVERLSRLSELVLADAGITICWASRRDCTPSLDTHKSMADRALVLPSAFATVRVHLGRLSISVGFLTQYVKFISLHVIHCGAAVGDSLWLWLIVWSDTSS